MTGTVTTLLRVLLEMDGGRRFAVGGVDDPGAGTGDVDGEVRLPLYADPRDGAPLVPGTSLAGALRDHLDRLADSWLGSPPPARQEQGEETTPSALWIRSARVDAGFVTARGRTAIDGRRGAAQPRSLRVEEAVDGAPALVVAMEHDGPADRDLRSALLTWRPVVGRGRSVGLGAASVTLVETVTVDRADRRDLHWWLTDRHRWYDQGGQPSAGPVTGYRRHGRDGSGAQPDTPRTRRFEPMIEASFVTTDPLRVGTAKVATKRERLGAKEVQRAPLMRSRGGDPVVPATTWKGIFRHRVTMILSLLGLPSGDVEAICAELFGSLTHGRGVLRFTDSVLAGARTVDYTHVAIDRFTGGARDEALFAVTAAPPGTPVPLVIQWLDPPGQDTKTWTDRLVRHVVADLHDGLVGVGGQSWRGYGTLALTDADTWPAPTVLSTRDLAGWATTLRARDVASSTASLAGRADEGVDRSPTTGEGSEGR